MRNVDYAPPKKRDIVKVTCDVCGAKCISDFADLTWFGISPEAKEPRPYFGGTFKIEAARPVISNGVQLLPVLNLPFVGQTVDMCQPCILRVSAAVLAECNNLAQKPFQMLMEEPKP